MNYYLSSDWHGNYQVYLDKCERYLPDDNNTLILLGDIGFKYGNIVNGRLLKHLSKTNNTYLVMRGNHDTRYCRDAQENERWKQKEKFGNIVWYDTKYPNIFYVKDEGGIYEIENHKCLFIPGAWSIDGLYRRYNHLPYEEEEQLTKKEQQDLLELAANKDFDFIFSHDCPISWQKELKDLFLDVLVVPDNSMNIFMEEIKDKANSFDKWFFGHYHSSRQVGNGKGQLVYNKPVKLF